MTSFHPYLFFAGFCREAFTRYQEVLGGELQLVTNADMPAEERMPGVGDDVIMHAALMVGEGLLMGSDDPTADEPRPVVGMQINLSVDSVAEAERIFEALAEGGQVGMPLTATSWSPAFGMLTDRFGAGWMLTVDDASTSP